MVVGLDRRGVARFRDEVKDEVEVEGEKPYADEAELAMAKRAPAAVMNCIVSI